jgi:pyruvate/2-oxoglutarate dehydrogenase complex dihydrolipoamide dehydrogenase (E3) component
MQVVVLGAGPAGISAALQAAELGAEVTLLEKDKAGGTSLNRGPAPVRTLARAARLARDWHSWDTFGLRGPAPVVDLRATLDNAERVARYAHERKHLAEQIRGLGVDLVEHTGTVRFVDPHTVAAEDGRTWTGDRVVIAVGGRPGRPPIPGAEHALTFEDLRTLEALPEEVCVIGGSDTGCQLASILADFGCRVRVVEHGPRLVGRADPEVSAGLEAAFRHRGIEVLTGARVQGLEPHGAGMRITCASDGPTTVLDVDTAFLAVGWPGNGDLTGAAEVGVVLERGYVAIDKFQRTSLSHVFAAGDADGTSMLVASARMEGRVAGENAVLGPRRRVLHEVVPAGSFTDPEYASVGLTEEQAAARYDVAVAVVRYEDLLRPVADGHPTGFCKLVVDTGTRRVVGAHVLGEYSAEVIQMVAACMAAGMRVEQIAEMQLAFPTFTEAVGMAAQQLARRLGVGMMPQVWSSLGPS